MNCRCALLWMVLFLLGWVSLAPAANDLDDLLVPPAKAVQTSANSMDRPITPSNSTDPSPITTSNVISGSNLEAVTSENSKSLFLDKAGSEDLSRFPEEAPMATVTVYITIFFAGLAFLIVWYKKQIKGKLKTNRGLPIQILGQTWLDGQTRVIVLRMGSKVLILAKSTQFCTTLDIITDPTEVNRLILGSGDFQGDEDFSAVLTEMNKKGSKELPPEEATAPEPPTEEQIRSDLEELKRQLGSLGSKKK